MNRAFFKMHGLGNDFVIFDGREHPFTPTKQALLAIADRHKGVGCDQFIIILTPKSPGADISVDMYNADGSPLSACGNAMRCLGKLMFEETGNTTVVIETVAGIITARQEDGGMIAVDFGPPRLEWNQIPLASEADTLHVSLSAGPLSDPCCVSMGNPHAVFFVSDVAKVELEDVGPRLERDVFFPDRCNIEVVQILSSDHIRMRVWERGTGITLACGSGACAALVASVRRGLTKRRATITLDGGDAIVEWRESDDHVILTGPAVLVYRGEMDDTFLTHVTSS